MATINKEMIIADILGVNANLAGILIGNLTLVYLQNSLKAFYRLYFFVKFSIFLLSNIE